MTQPDGEELRALRELASRVSHDLNNLLTMVLGSVEWLLLDVPPGMERSGELETIRTAALDAAALVTSLQVGLRRPSRLADAAAVAQPARAAGPVRLPPESKPQERPRPIRLDILLVDDQEEVCESVSEMLRALGHAPACARSGEQALEMLKTRAFDVVVTDFGMPSMDGLELARRVRQQWSLPVILLTGWGCDSEETSPPDIALVVPKPVTLAALARAVAETTAARAA